MSWVFKHHAPWVFKCMLWAPRSRHHLCTMVGRDRPTAIKSCVVIALAQNRKVANCEDAPARRSRRTHSGSCRVRTNTSRTCGFVSWTSRARAPRTCAPSQRVLTFAALTWCDVPLRHVQRQSSAMPRHVLQDACMGCSEVCPRRKQSDVSQALAHHRSSVRNYM